MATLAKALAELPDTPQKIAEMLHSEGVKGRKGRCFQCPLAEWLSRRVGCPVSVDGFQCRLAQNQIYLDLPSAARRFVLDFDDDTYPELVAS